jgi:hypothetical protein
MTYFITTKTDRANPDAKIRVLSTAEKRDSARMAAATAAGTVRVQSEIDTLIAEGRLDQTTLPGYVAPEPVAAEPAKTTGRWTDIAANIAKTHKRATTLGAKVKKPARADTPEAVMTAATVFAQGIAGESKVAFVRALANWKSTDGTQLQRRDAFVIAAQVRADIAAATVSTQWQVARGPKAPTAE